MPLNPSLKISLIDAFFFSLMVGIGESYFAAFGLHAGMGEALVGLFAILPMFLGSLLQLLSPFMMQKFGSVKKFVIFSTVLQAMSFLPMIYLSLHPSSHFWIYFLVAALYWGSGFCASPSWNYWMGFLLNPKESPHYFSKRLRITQIGIFFGLFSGGVILQNNWILAPLNSVFAVMFTIAFLARCTSSILLAFKNDTSTPVVKSSITSFRDSFAQFFEQKSYRQFFSFLFIFYVVIYLTSPFVNPFFLKKMDLSYERYMWCIAMLIIAKMTILPFSQKLIDKFGVKNVFFVGALGLSPLPGLWVFSHDYVFTLCLQFISGLFWGLFELSLSVIFFSKIQAKDKIAALSLFNIFNAVAMAIGTVVGGKFLFMMHESWNGYYMLFVGGAFLRVVCVGVFYKMTKASDLLVLGDLEPWKIKKYFQFLRPLERFLRQS